MNTNYSYLFKILIIGDASVGKTAILNRYIDDVYTPIHISTIGIDFKVRTMECEDKIIKLQIWDTAGQERFKTIVSSYYRGAHGIFIVYDITDENSFNNVKMWLTECRKHANENVPIILIGNKSDMNHKRKISYEQGLECANKYDLKFMETSAQSNSNVNLSFTILAGEALKTFEKKTVCTLKSINDKCIGPKKTNKTCC